MNYRGAVVPSMLKDLVAAMATAAAEMGSPEVVVKEAPVAVTNRQPKSRYLNR